MSEPTARALFLAPCREHRLLKYSESQPSREPVPVPKITSPESPAKGEVQKSPPVVSILKERLEKLHVHQEDETVSRNEEQSVLQSLEQEISDTTPKVLPEDLQVMSYGELKDFARSHVPGLNSLGIDFQTSNAVDVKNGTGTFSIYDKSASRLDDRSLLATISVNKKGEVVVSYDQNERLADLLFSKVDSEWKPGMDAQLLRGMKDAIKRVGQLPDGIDAAAMLRVRRPGTNGTRNQLFEFFVETSSGTNPTRVDQLVLGAIEKDAGGEYTVNMSAQGMKKLSRVLAETPNAIIRR